MGGKSKSLYGGDGHMGITLVKFPTNQWGLDEATRLADFVEKEKLGRQGWSRLLQMTVFGKDGEKNRNLVEVEEKTWEKRRVFYGYSGTAADLDKVDYETKSKTVTESRGECQAYHQNSFSFMEVTLIDLTAVIVAHSLLIVM